MSGLPGGDRLEVAAVLGLTLYDIYMASTILGAGYVVVSAVLGNFHFSASGDAGHGTTARISQKYGMHGEGSRRDRKTP